MENIGSSSEENRFSMLSPAGCFIIILFVIILFGAGIGIVLAKSGYYNIPILTNVFYKQNFPQKKVEPASGKVENLIAKKLSESIIKNNKINPDILTLEVNDQEATALLLNQIKNFKNKDYEISGAQIAFLSNSAEFFANFSKNQSKTSLKIVFSPFYKDGVLSLNITKIEAGNLSVPVFMLKAVSNFFYKQNADAIKEKLDFYGIEEFYIEGNLLKLKLNFEALKGFAD